MKLKRIKNYRKFSLFFRGCRMMVANLLFLLMSTWFTAFPVNINLVVKQVSVEESIFRSAYFIYRGSGSKTERFIHRLTGAELLTVATKAIMPVFSLLSI